MVVASVIVAGGSAGVSAWWLPGGWAALVGAVGASAGGIWSARGLARRDAVTASASQLPQLLSLDRRGRLPVVADCTDPVALGVHRAAGGDGVPDQAPVFVPRDVSEQLEAMLVPGRFVLLVGESTAGKTRTAYEAMRARAGDRLLIEPAGRQAILAAIEAAQQARRSSVIWLDDLERFLGTGGLSRTDIRNLLRGGARPHCILATMRSEEYARFMRIQYRGPDHLSAETQRQGEEVLRLARQIHLSRSWSASEVQRASAYVADPRIGEALQQARRFGVAEYLAAGPKLLRDWQDAWAVGGHPRGAALVAAGVLARRSGIHRPLSETVLTRVAQSLLDERGGTLLRPEPLSEALAWATAPLHATSSLLLPHPAGGHLAFDYLVDALPKLPPPPAAIAALVEFATPDEAIDLAELAWGWYRLDQAEDAFRCALDHPVRERRSYALNMLSYVIAERHGEGPALRFTTDVVRERTERLGPEHPDTFDARHLQAWRIRHSGSVQEALLLMEELRSALETEGRANTLPMLHCRRAIAAFRGESGDGDWAAAEFSRLARDWAALTGPDDIMALGCRLQHARLVGSAGRADECVRLLRQMLREPRLADWKQGREDVLGQLAYALCEAGDFTEASSLYRTRLTELERREGPGRAETLYTRYELASCIGHLGDAPGAVRMLEDIVRIRAEANDEIDIDWLLFRRRLATWIGMAGDPGEAARRLNQLATLSEQVRGEQAHMTLACRSRAAHWTAAAGNPEQGIRELARTLADCEQSLGPHDELTQSCQERLGYWRAANQTAHRHPPTA
jgi:hypothetical protein